MKLEGEALGHTSAGILRQRTNWIETYGGMGASLLLGIWEELFVKGPAGWVFRWVPWSAKSSSQVL